jgi:predicted thioredoxin/glutaredoxin
MNMAALYAYGREHNLIMGLPSVFVNGVLVPGDATTPGVVARAIENAQ